MARPYELKLFPLSHALFLFFEHSNNLCFRHLAEIFRSPISSPLSPVSSSCFAWPTTCYTVKPNYSPLLDFPIQLNYFHTLSLQKMCLFVFTFENFTCFGWFCRILDTQARAIINVFIMWLIFNWMKDKLCAVAMLECIWGCVFQSRKFSTEFWQQFQIKSFNCWFRRCWWWYCNAK